jgi:hypothetical protein
LGGTPRASVEGNAFLHVTDSKIVDFSGSVDLMGLMQQIGGLPVPSQAG